MSRSRSSPPPDRPAIPRTAIAALLGSDASDPIRRALWLDTLDHQLHSYLPPGLAAHARLANIDRGRLVYLVDAPVWHARLRLAATDILDAARSIGLEVTDLVVKTASGPQAMRPQHVGSATTITAIPLSAAAREAFATALASDGDAPPRKDSP